MTIKPITENEVDNCANVFIQAYNQAPWNYQWNIDGAVKYLREYLSSAQFKGFVLYDNDMFVGAMFAHSKTWWTGDQLFIDELFISPSLQKKGYGKKLVKYTEEFAAEQGLATITLMTHKFMPAMKFYEDIDFIHAQPFVILFKQTGGFNV